jgi:hypothetical protein
MWLVGPLPAPASDEPAPKNKNPAIYGGVQSGGESLTGSL